MENCVLAFPDAFGAAHDMWISSNTFPNTQSTQHNVAFYRHENHMLSTKLIHNAFRLSTLQARLSTFM